MRIIAVQAFVFAMCVVHGWSQSFTFVRVAGGDMRRPDGNGAYSITLLVQPAIEGNYVMFREQGFGGMSPAIWSHNLSDGSYRKLVDLQTAAPGGTGNFSSLMSDSNPVLKKGIVTFLARDQRDGPNDQGIYTVPVAGGPISRVANYNTASPSGGQFLNFDTNSKPSGGFDADGRITFWSRNTAGVTGVYAAEPDGSLPSLIADSEHAVRPRTTFPVYLFSNPAISGNTILFYGQNVFDPSAGANALYTTTATGPTGTLADGSPNFNEIFTSATQLPGNPNANFHTRINIPSLQLDGNTVAFIADDTNSRPQYRGIFTIPVTGGPVTRVAASDSSLPGLGTLNPLNSFGFCLNQDRIVFHAQDTTGGSPGNHGLYLWQNGTITKIIGTGDMLDGARVTEISVPGLHCVDGNRIVFPVASVGRGYNVYVAMPPDPNIRVTGAANAASYASQRISPGEILTIFGSGMGPAVLATFSLDANQRMFNSISNSRILINGSPAPPIYVSSGQSSVVAPFSLATTSGASADIVAVNNGSASALFRIPVAATVAGLFSGNSTGSGQGAILNQDGSYNSQVPAAKGSVVSIYGTGHGRTDPALIEGQVAPLAQIPRLVGRVSVTIGGMPVAVSYAGPAPGLVAGVLQVNATIPANAPSGGLPVIVTIDSDASQSGLTVSVR